MAAATRSTVACAQCKLADATTQVQLTIRNKAGSPTTKSFSFCHPCGAKARDVQAKANASKLGIKKPAAASKSPPSPVKAVSVVLASSPPEPLEEVVAPKRNKTKEKISVVIKKAAKPAPPPPPAQPVHPADSVQDRLLDVLKVTPVAVGKPPAILDEQQPPPAPAIAIPTAAAEPQPQPMELTPAPPTEQESRLFAATFEVVAPPPPPPAPAAIETPAPPPPPVPVQEEQKKPEEQKALVPVAPPPAFEVSTAAAENLDWLANFFLADNAAPQLNTFSGIPSPIIDNSHLAPLIGFDSNNFLEDDDNDEELARRKHEHFALTLNPEAAGPPLTTPAAEHSLPFPKPVLPPSLDPVEERVLGSLFASDLEGEYQDFVRHGMLLPLPAPAAAQPVPPLPPSAPADLNLGVWLLHQVVERPHPDGNGAVILKPHAAASFQLAYELAQQQQQEQRRQQRDRRHGDDSSYQESNADDDEDELLEAGSVSPSQKKRKSSSSSSGSSSRMRRRVIPVAVVVRDEVNVELKLSEADQALFDKMPAEAQKLQLKLYDLVKERAAKQGGQLRGRWSNEMNALKNSIAEICAEHEQRKAAAVLGAGRPQNREYRV